MNGSSKVDNILFLQYTKCTNVNQVIPNSHILSTIHSSDVGLVAQHISPGVSCLLRIISWSQYRLLSRHDTLDLCYFTIGPP